MKWSQEGTRARTRIAVVLWPFLLYTVWSCAQGSDLGGVGGAGGFGPAVTSSTGLASGSVTSTIASSTTGPGVGGAAGVGSSSGVGGSSGFGGTSGFGGSGVGGAGGASSASSSSSGGVDGFGPCVTQAQIDAQSTGGFGMGFCTGFHPFKCLMCPDPAVNPGDIVCSPTCVCTALPPLCTDADAGTGGAGTGGAGTGGAATSGTGTGGAATSGAGTGGAAANDAGTDDAATDDASTDDASIADASTE